MNQKEIYKTLCAKNASLTVFMQPWWLDVVCHQWDAVIVANGDEAAGAWAYPIENKMGVRLLRTPMLTPYLGPHVFCPADLKESRRDSFQHDTISDLLKLLPPAKVWHLALSPEIKQAGLFKKHRLQTEVQQTFLLDLHEDESVLFANIKESARRNIRAAEKEITIADEAGSLAQLFRFQQNTLGGKGKELSYDLNYLQRIMDACRAHHATALWTATGPTGVEAIVWQVWDKHTSYYLMGGQNPESSGYKAMSLLLWHAIRESKKRGNTTFDFEGSMDEGVERFFRNFGAERTLYLVLQKNESLLWKIKKVLRK